MKVVDARTGRALGIGSVVDGGGVIQQIDAGLLKASAVVYVPGSGNVRVPLIVRWTHPKRFLQHTAFFPS